MTKSESRTTLIYGYASAMTKGLSTTCRAAMRVAVIFLLGLACDVAVADTSAGAKRFPPYPDVWDWVAPKTRPETTLSGVKMLDGGDVLIAYQRGLGASSEGVAFFDRKRDVRKDIEAFRQDPRSDLEQFVPYKPGQVLRASGSESGRRSQGCYAGLWKQVAVFDDSLRNYSFGKTLLYLLDKPRRWHTQEHCGDGESFRYRVIAVWPKFVGLEDGTFLLVSDDPPMVVRFDQEFQTKSRLMNDRLFWIDTRELEEFDARYGDRALGDKNLKQMHADLYRLLSDKRKGDKR